MDNGNLGRTFPSPQVKSWSLTFVAVPLKRKGKEPPPTSNKLNGVSFLTTRTATVPASSIEFSSPPHSPSRPLHIPQSTDSFKQKRRKKNLPTRYCTRLIAQYVQFHCVSRNIIHSSRKKERDLTVDNCTHSDGRLYKTCGVGLTPVHLDRNQDTTESHI